MKILALILFSIFFILPTCGTERRSTANALTTGEAAIGSSEIREFLRNCRVKITDKQDPNTLTNLNLTMCTKVNDETLKYISDLTNLKRLILTNTNLSDKGLKHLTKLVNLNILTLYGVTKITNAGLIHLTDLTSLVYIDVSKSKISNAGIQNIKGLPSLVYINCEQTKITSDGISVFNSYRADNKLSTTTFFY
jgi:hypothetical protein